MQVWAAGMRLNIAQKGREERGDKKEKEEEQKEEEQGEEEEMSLRP